jgi:hypothetical protein
MQQMLFIADLTACSTCFGHHFAHHQKLESFIQLVAACGAHHTDNLKTKHQRPQAATNCIKFSSS